tara:strand:- start:129 stop:3935 length:3807 start_codon:yes stop_codon:yes gene_type:complete
MTVPKGLTPINNPAPAAAPDVPKGLTPISEPEAPGFFDSLRPIRDLWKYESLPVAYLQWQGNDIKGAPWLGKSKQENAKIAKEWLDANPDQAGTEEYNYHSKILKLYGYAIDPQPFSMSAVTEAIRTNPGMFGAEMVNMLLADPYLILPWFWNPANLSAKSLQFSAALSKVANSVPRITEGTMKAIGATPTLTAYSSLHQLSENRMLDPKRTATELAFGGSLAFGLGAITAGTVGKGSKLLGLSHDQLMARIKEGLTRKAADGDALAKQILEGKRVSSYDDILKLIIDDIEDSSVGFNPNKWEFIVDKDGNPLTGQAGRNFVKRMLQDKDSGWTTDMPYGYLKEKGIFYNRKDGTMRFDKNKLEQEWKLFQKSKDPIAAYFKDFDQYLSWKAEIVRIKNSPKYSNRNKYPNDEAIRKEALKNHYNRSYESNKVHQALRDELMPIVEDAYHNLVITNNTRWYHMRNLKNLDTPLVAGGILGGGAYITTGEEESFWTGAAVGLGGVSVWKAAGSIYSRNKSLQQGNKLSQLSEENLGTRLQEIKDNLPEGVTLDDIALKEMPSFYQSPNVKKSDLIKLGRAEEIELSKSQAISGYLMDDYRSYVLATAQDVNRLKEIIIGKVPDKSRREAITKYIQEKEKVTKLSKEELAVAKDVQKTMNAMWEALDGTEIKFNFLRDYLPQYWLLESFKGELDIVGQINDLIKNNSKLHSGMKGRTISELEKMFPTYEAGIAQGLKPATLDVAEIMARYINSTTRALGQRRLTAMLKQAPIIGRSDGAGGNVKLMYSAKDGIPTKVNPQDYVRFYHPAFLNPKIDITKYSQKALNEMSPFVFREAEPVLRMLYDAKTEGAVLKAISNFNFLQKRFSVGYSFFHAETLLQNMLYTGMSIPTTVKTAAAASGLGKIPLIRYLVPDWRRTQAKQMLMEAGHYDDLKAATRAGVEFSHPEDIGYNRFYNMLGNAQQWLDKSPIWGTWLAKQGIKHLVERPFRWIDDITWDRVYNAGKLYAFQTARLKLLENPKYKNLSLREIDKRAAVFTNDAYGGLNWTQMYRDTADPFLKAIRAEAYKPSGRRLLQLALFAPDWTTANLRIWGRAFPGINKDPISRKLYQSYVIRGAVIIGTAGTALQYMFTGKSLLDNADPTRVDLGNGYSLSLSKQYFEPFHWATHPFKTLVSKQGSTLKLTEQLLLNKQFLTSPWPSPIAEKDRNALQKAYDYGSQVTMSFVPFSFRGIVQEIADKGSLSIHDALRELMSIIGHPIYNIPRNEKYKGI